MKRGFFSVLVAAGAMLAFAPQDASAQGLVFCATCNNLTVQCDPNVPEPDEFCNSGTTGGGWCYSDNSGPGEDCTTFASLNVEGIVPELTVTAIPSSDRFAVLSVIRDCRNRIRSWTASAASALSSRRETHTITI